MCFGSSHIKKRGWLVSTVWNTLSLGKENFSKTAMSSKMADEDKTGSLRTTPLIDVSKISDDRTATSGPYLSHHHHLATYAQWVTDKPTTTMGHQNEKTHKMGSTTLSPSSKPVWYPAPPPFFFVITTLQQQWTHLIMPLWLPMDEKGHSVWDTWTRIIQLTTTAKYSRMFLRSDFFTLLQCDGKNKIACLPSVRRWEDLVHLIVR